MRLVDLTVEGMTEPLGMWTDRPRFGWIVEDAPGMPDACRIEVSDPRGVVWDSGVLDRSDGILVPYAGEPLAGMRAYRWRVQVRVSGVWSSWVESRFETTMLDLSAWAAPFVEPVQETVTPDGPRRADGDWVPPVHDGPPETRLHPCPHLRQGFTLAEPALRARLYATARGVYAAEINGLPVGDEVLAPGYESYHRLLSVQVYDVTAQLRVGENVLGVVLGDGWYAGRIDFTGTSAQYGERLQAGWELHVETAAGIRVITSGPDVRSTTDGPLRYSDIFIGEAYDARAAMPGWSEPGYDDSAWSAVTSVPAPDTLVPFIGEPVRRTEVLQVAGVLTTPRGDTVIDVGQVIAGRMRLRLDAPAGTRITLEHSEVLDADGEFFRNIAGFNKDQTDVYVAAGVPGGEDWEPLFTFHGFRYVRVTGLATPPRPEDVQAVVLGSDLRQTGDFACADPDITRLHRNAVWSQRGNFLAIPTDCPQRERVGWTGDLQIFAPAAMRNMASANFLRRWLRNVRADQEADGVVPVIVPAPPFMDSLSHELADDPLLSIRAAAGWGDAIVIVPWLLYERYGDELALAENWDAMQAWVDRQARVAADELPERLREFALPAESRERQRMLWNSERNFGDWNAPSTKRVDPSLEHMLHVARTTGELIAPLFQLHSTELLSRAASVLGRERDAQTYAERAGRIRAAFAGEYVDSRGRLLVESQGTYVLALAFGAIPAEVRPCAVDRLVALVHENGDRLDTGFLSVPYLLDVLWDGGQRELARTLLWQRSAPSWLYAVERGATTVWEEWAAIAEDGTPGEASFNHYAFGCVDDWLYGRLAGIRFLEPAGRRIRLEPDVAAPPAWVEAYQDTPLGRFAVRWERTAGGGELRVQVPVGMTVEVVLPGRSATVGTGEHTLDWTGS